MRNYIPNEQGCWIWQGAKSNGYGYVYDSARRKPRMAHRLAARTWMGFPDDDPKVMVLHKCDTRACINPAHLYFGSGTDNARDREERNSQRGERNRTAKLTWNEVRAIRALLEGGFTHRDIAGWFGISRENVGQIARNQTWVTDSPPSGLPSFSAVEEEKE